MVQRIRRRRKSTVTVVAAVALVASSLAVAAGPVRADTSYTVKRNDSITLIARTTGVSVPALLQANGLRIDSVIHPGQVLTIPDGSPGAGTYSVQRGDGLRIIARRLGVAVDALLQANGLRISSTIHPGQALVIPTGGHPPLVPVTTPVPTPATAPVTGPVTAPVTAPVAGGPSAASLPKQVRARADLVPVFQAAAAEAGIAPDLLMAIGYHESRWQADAVSSAGALGVCQVMPGTAAWVARDMIGEPGLSPRTAPGGIRIGAHLMRWLLDQAGGDLDRALAMYAQGVGGVQRNGISASSRRFIDQIAGLRPQFT